MKWPFGKKAATPIVHSGGGTTLAFLSNSDSDSSGTFNYSKRVGTGLGSSLIMAPIQWVQRAMMESPVVVEMQQADGEWEIKDDHPLALSLNQPNPYYAGINLWAGTLFSYYTDGNAYWMIIPAQGGWPAELWYVPHWMLHPVGSRDGSKFLTHYQYTVNGKRYDVPPEQIVHFRHGIDPQNPRLGISPLQSAIKEIWTDMEAAEFIATLLRNNGIPGLLITPDSEHTTVSPADMEDLKRYIRNKTTGSHRGEPLAISGKTKVHRLPWSPKEMDLSPASDRSEERVCALMGIPAAVVGFSAGLEQTKVGATMAEMRKLAWWNGVLPTQHILSGEVESSLLPLYGETKGLRVRFDNSDVAALQEDEDKLFKRADMGVKSGWLTVGAGMKMVGLDSGPEHDYYLRGLAVTAVPASNPIPNESEEEEEEEGEEDIGEGEKSAPATDMPSSKETHPASALEERLARTASRAEATPGQLAYIGLQESMAPRLEAKLRPLLEKFFEELGEKAAIAARAILEPKAIADDPLAAERILDAMKIEDITPIFAGILETHYLLTAEESTALAMETIGLATGIPDHVARAIQATGGTRAGLIDLGKQVKEVLFKAIEEGRAEGLGADALARKIAGLVEAGPWTSKEVRARVIARTETKYAQRISTLHLGKENGVRQFRVFDARLGVTDPDCEMLDGILVDAATADELAASEHPNGTRDFVPHF